MANDIITHLDDEPVQAAGSLRMALTMSAVTDRALLPKALRDRRGITHRNSLIDRDAIFTMLVVPTAFGVAAIFDHSAMP